METFPTDEKLTQLHETYKQLRLPFATILDYEELEPEMYGERPDIAPHDNNLYALHEFELACWQAVEQGRMTASEAEEAIWGFTQYVEQPGVGTFSPLDSGPGIPSEPCESCGFDKGAEGCLASCYRP